jgi:histidine triad (HIT) family protein
MYNHAPTDYICPFCLVVQGIENEHVWTKQSDIIYKDNAITAFIAAGCWSNNKGHVLIIPNQHYENIYELPLSLSARIHDFEKEVALAFKEVYKCDGVSSRQHNEPCGSQDVWHYHLHVFPRYENDNLYKTDRERLPPHERFYYADMLRKYFNEKNKNRTKELNKKAFQLFGASIIIYKDGKVLLQQRKDNKCWAYHGGRVELGESVEETAKRELFEETGLTAYSLQLFGVYSGSELHYVYPDGNEVYIIDTVYLCNDFSGEPIFQKEECIDLQWFDISNIPQNLSPPAIPALSDVCRAKNALL